MSTTTEPAGVDPTGHDAHHHPAEFDDHETGHLDELATHEHHDPHKSTGYYIVVALILAGLTALETSTYWVDFGPLFLPALLIMMTIKFFMVVLLFMHLKFDNRLFGILFYAGLGLAVFVYVVALATFNFFGT